jgi:hypothetical protein
MNQEIPKVLDRENVRRQLIEELIADEGPDWAEQHKPGSFDCHELLDRTALTADLVERYVLSHPACVVNEDWYRLAEQASDALHELYQRVGEAHLSASR